jgi:hypothetical protein
MLTSSLAHMTDSHLVTFRWGFGGKHVSLMIFQENEEPMKYRMAMQ